MNKRDELIDLLRDRLSDAEAHVDPSLWQGIQQRMTEAAIAGGTDPVTELFRNGLKDAEAPVDPGVWANVSSQLGHGVTAGTSLTAWVGGGLAAAVVAGGLWIGLSTNEEPAAVVQQEPVAVVQPVVEQPIVEEQPAEEIVVNATVPETIEDVSPRTENPGAPLIEETSSEPTPAALQQSEPDPPVTEDPPHTGDQAPKREENPPPPPTPGPDIGKVEAIINQAQQEVNNSPKPKEQNDPQIPPTYVAPGTDVPTLTDEDPAPKPEAASLFIPNVFTPNNDGVNDALEVSATGLTNIRVSIYSAATDKLMFRANDLSPWDGRDPGGTMSPEGYYFYAIEATGPDGKPMSKGQVVRLFTH